MPDVSRPPQPTTAAPRWFAAVALALALIPAFAFWWSQGQPVVLPAAPGDRLPCVSYAPYRGSQTPFDERLVIPPEQIEDDLRQLRTLTSCVRTYALDQGLEAVPRIAEDLGMTVLLGVWVGREREKNAAQIERAIDLAHRHPATVEAVIVGNEVLLRREQPPAELAAMIRRVADAIDQPVTYADVWEFWEKHPEIARAVDFVTIHTLPYWEDEPRPVHEAVEHVVAVWREMSARFPDRRVIIGEAGWPSAGRMREGALPSRVNQARFVRELMIEAEREGFRLNLIEAFDQPWKRRMEGTVGGHWGLFDQHRTAKLPLSGPIAATPTWRLDFVLGAVLALSVLVPVLARRATRITVVGWLGAAMAASATGVLLVIGGRDGIDASLDVWDWAVFALRWLGAALSAMLVLVALADAGDDPRERRPTPLGLLLDRLRRCDGPAPPALSRVLGWLRAIVLFGAAASTLCLVFDPRYREFVWALYAVPAVAFLTLALAAGRGRTSRAPSPPEERLLAAVLAAGAVAVVVGEGIENHQALAWAAVCLLLATTAVLDRPAQAAATGRVPRTSVSAASSTPPEAASGA